MYPHHVGVGGLHPQAIIRDAPVGGVNVEHLVHRRDVEEDEERRGWGYLRGEVFGAEMPFLGHAKSALRLASETIEEIAVSSESYRELAFGECAPGALHRPVEGLWSAVCGTV